jgi:hypothetical protein
MVGETLQIPDEIVGSFQNGCISSVLRHFLDGAAWPRHERLAGCNRADMERRFCYFIVKLCDNNDL